MNLNIRKRRWVDLINHYDFDIHYHPDKCHSGYSQQEVVSLFCLDQAQQLVLHEGFEKFGVELVNSVYLANFEIRPTLRMNQEV